MARAVHVIERPITGDRIGFRGAAEHIHPAQAEHFEVISGTLGSRK